MAGAANRGARRRTLWGPRCGQTLTPWARPARPRQHRRPGQPAVNLLAQQLKARDKAFLSRRTNFYLRKTLTTRQESPGWPKVCVSRPRYARPGCTQPLPRPLKALRWPSPISRPACAALTPVTVRRQALRAFATHWTIGWRWPDSGCMATCMRPATMCTAGCRVVANPLGYARKNEQLGTPPTIFD